MALAQIQSNCCPKCKSAKSVIPVVYGALNDRAKKEIDTGKAFYGGKKIRLTADQWYCKKHETTFGPALNEKPGLSLVKSEADQDLVRSGGVLA